MRKSKDNWAVDRFIKRYKKGNINFDNPIQRGIVWNKKQSSLYIHSLLFDILIYQKPFLASKKENGVWDILDGKQRGTTLIKYVNGEFALTGVKSEPDIILNGEVVPLEGRRFNQLPDELQWKIIDFQIDVACLEDATPEMEALMFNRSNSGKSMSKIDMARSKASNMEDIVEFREHDLFKVMFSDKMLNKLSQDEIVVKSWIALNETDPDYSAKHYESVLQDLEMTDEDKVRIKDTYDKIFAAYKYLFVSNKDIAQMIINKTHILSYMFVVERFEDGQKLALWLRKFYRNMPAEYTEGCEAHTTTQANVRVRMGSIEKSIEEYFGEPASKIE